MNTKTNFRYRISDNAFEVMGKILRNPEVTGPEINGQLCRITNSYDVTLSIKDHYLPEYKDDELLRVRLQNDDSREFVVMRSLLEDLKGD